MRDGWVARKAAVGSRARTSGANDKPSLHQQESKVRPGDRGTTLAELATAAEEKAGIARIVMYDPACAVIDNIQDAQYDGSRHDTAIRRSNIVHSCQTDAFYTLLAEFGPVMQEFNRVINGSRGMTLTRLGIIGYGSIASTLIDVLNGTLEMPLEHLVCLVRTRSLEPAGSALGRFGRIADNVTVVDTLEKFLAVSPQLAIECAGHSAVASFGVALLENGVETVITSIGALSDDTLHSALVGAAIAGNTRMVLPAGAAGGIDILSAVRHSGIREVTYTSRKPPHAWRETPAEDLLDLERLTKSETFYRGSARAAAADYPKNANVAATIALAGAGFDLTKVQLVADPAAECNIHEFSVDSPAASLKVTIKGQPSPDNPKTSLPTVYSLVREVMNRVSPVAI